MFSLIQHRKLAVEGNSASALELADLLAEASLSFPVFAIQSSSLLLLLWDRFKDAPPFVELGVNLTALFMD